MPHLQENPDHEKLLNGVNDIFELCSVYTSLPQMRVRFSDCLLCKKPIFTDAALLELSKQTSEILRNRDGEIKDDFFDNIADNLEMIIDHHDSVPAYVERAAKIEISPLKSHILPEACGSVRTIVSTSTSPKLIEDLLSRLVVDSAICAAMQINFLSKSLPFLQQQIEQNPTMFNDETRFNYVKLENAIKHSDTALLLQCQSLPTAVFNFKAMRTVDDSLQLLLQSIAGIDKIKSIVQPLMGCGKEYSNWIFQSDLAMMSYFQANMDSITISLENAAINDKTHSLPPTTRQFIRQAVSLLRFKERGYSYDMTIISKLAQLFLKFQTDILPQIKTKLSDSDSKKDILYHSDALDKIKSVLKLWANPIEGLSNESLRLTVSASLFNSIATVKSIQDSIDSESILIPHLFQPLNSKLSLVLAKLEKGVELKMPFKDSQVSSVTAHRFSKEISSEEALLNVSQLKVDSDKLLNLISSCSSLVIKAVPIEFADFDEIQLFSGSYQSLFALIDDKDCLKFAQAIAAYLDKLLQSMKTMSTSSDIISNGPQKYFTPLQIKGQNGKPLNITTVPSKLNNFVGAYTTRFINDNSIKNISKSLEKSIESASQPSVHLRECSFEEIQRLMLAQRFSILQQQQIAEFPDVIKTIAIKGNLPYLNLTTDTIDSAIQSLQQQYEALNSPSDLRKVQSRFSPEQIYVQQVVLTHAIHSIVQKRCSLPTATAAQSTNSSRKMLFEEILKYLESNGSPSETASFDDLHSGVSRGFSQISLINQLIAIMQQLNVNSPDIFKFIQTVEGGQFLKMPITSHQLLEQQQNVIKQVQLSDAPEMLNAFQQNLLPEDIILQQRIIQHMLNLLSSEYGENLLLQKDLETSNTAILASINLQQQELIKTDTEILKLSAYVTPSDIIQWQNFSFNIFNRVCCAQTLLEIASRQLKLNSNAASLPKNVKNIKATKESTKAQHNNLLKEYDLINIDSLIKSLNKKQLEDEQNILGVSAFLALAPKIISGYDSNLGIIMSTIFSSLQTQQSEQLRFTGEPLNGFNPLKDSSIINEHEIADFTCLNLRRIHQIKYLMSHFEIQFPELKKLSIPTFTQDQLNQTKAILTRIMENSSNPILTNQFIDKEIPKDEIPKLYSLLTVSATHTSAQSIDLDTIQELKNESNLFDMAALIQRQSDIGFSSASPNEKMVLPLEQLKSAIETCKIKFICEAAKEFVNNLMIIHSTVYPEVATISMCATDLNSLFENNKGDIENQIGSITSQFKVINESEKLNSILRRLSPSSYLTQQVMLQSLIKMLDSEQVRQVIVASADLNDSNAILDILSSLTGILGSQYQTDKTTFTNAKPPLHNELTLSSKLLEENKGRLSLAMKLFNLQLNIRTAFGNVETIIASNKDFQSATNEPFTIDEIVNIQDTFRIILATDTVNTTEIANYFKVQKPQITTRMLSLLNNLTLIISPKSLGLSLVKADSSSPDEEIYGLPSLFNSMQIIRDTGIGSTTTEIKIPSEKQRANRVAGSLNGILTILPTMIHIPIEECLSILIAENQAALEIVKDLYKSKSTAYSKRIPDLIEIIPQLLSSLARSMTTFPLNIRSMIVKEPIEIITSIENIQKLSCLESTPENSASFKTQLTTLLSALSNIDAATSKPSDDLLLRSIECFARMATAIQRNDIDTLNYQICVFKALTVHATIYKLNDSYLKSIIPGIEKVTPIVKEKFTTHSTLDSNKQQILSSFRDQLVQIINKETKNPFTFLNSLNKQGDIPPVINKSKVDLENSTNGLINSVHLRDRESTVTNIGDIIKVITLSQSTMAKSFNLTKATTIPAYTDYVTMINSSLNAMRATMDIVKTTAISSTAIRRSTRSFARMLNSMIDIAEDQANISDNKSSPSKLEKCRLDFLKSVCDSVQMVTATVSTRATCFIPETFVLFTKSELPKLQQQIASLKKVGCELSTTNTDKSATEDFTAEINKLEESLNLFQNLSSDNNKIESPNSIFNLTNGFINIVDHVTKAISVSQRFTDKVQLKPDLESAEKLKKFYHVPSVPSDTDKLKVSDASRSLETFISTYKTKATAFFTLVDNKSSKNAQIVDSMNSLYDNIDNVVKQILRISATTMNLGIQSELTTLCVGIAKSYDSLLKGLRAKFVLSGDWDKQGKILYKQINENIDTALALSKKAVKIADEESRMKSAIFTKFDECLKPLIQVTSTLDKSKEKISKLESTTPCEYSLRMLEIAIALSSAVNKVMLHSRGHTNNLTPAHETLFKFTQNISKELTQIEKATSEITNPNYKNDIEPKIIERMKTIFELGTQYTKSSKTSSPEETALRDAITTICKGANSLAQSAESALNARKEREGGKINSVKAGPSKDTLLKRLDLESKVIRARIVLEFNEKVLASMQ
ncbi:hypothetical protein TRFO_20136 [Tritrichomonas foetus]|uniref:Uncharacterized protein n=1 Tax=Tritrichomonas foetus TaxID=1144522 RepID=A0A1J4KHY5_9EUKA|nr:hypothetical protein TRFO_20136 [Tritrichomonas foetus]|eukprot:OHT10544.1 hypothetical protein TRFO_20136 [Tritrichomonas foetus]